MDESLKADAFAYHLVQGGIRERVASLAAEYVFFSFIRSEHHSIAVAFAACGEAFFDDSAGYGVSIHQDRNIT